MEMQVPPLATPRTRTCSWGPRCTSFGRDDKVGGWRVGRDGKGVRLLGWDDNSSQTREYTCGISNWQNPRFQLR